MSDSPATPATPKTSPSTRSTGTYAIEAGTVSIVIAGAYDGLDNVAQAQQDLETGDRPGKRVVLLPSS